MMRMPLRWARVRHRTDAGMTTAEYAVGTLMSCWARAGEHGRAARHYCALVERLRDELGVTPAAQTTALYRRLLRPDRPAGMTGPD